MLAAQPALPNAFVDISSFSPPLRFFELILKS
jgi:hypothetical protein